MSHVAVAYIISAPKLLQNKIKIKGKRLRHGEIKQFEVIRDSLFYFLAQNHSHQFNADNIVYLITGYKFEEINLIICYYYLFS